MLDRATIKGMSVVSVDDTGIIRSGVLTGMGTTRQGQIISPYGLCSNPPTGSLAIALNVLGQASDTVAIVDDPKLRKKALLPGEVALVNYITKSEVYMQIDGSILIKTTTGSTILVSSTGDVSITGTNINLIGNVLASANITASGNISAVNIAAASILTTGIISASDFSTSTIPSLNAHVHAAGALLDSVAGAVTGTTGTGS